MEIHPTALVSPKAQLAEDVKIEAFSIVGPEVSIGSGSVVGPHAVIDGWTTLGERNRVFPFATLGYPPQDLSYRGEETRLVIGNDNIFRESVTINRATQRGGGETRIGDRNLFMAYAHVAHDCVIGNNVILANATTLGGMFVSMISRFWEELSPSTSSSASAPTLSSAGSPDSGWTCPPTCLLSAPPASFSVPIWSD